LNKSITIKEVIRVEANQTDVWNFTQDFALRKVWVHSITELDFLRKKPNKLVKLKTVGGIVTKLSYKLYRKPFKTSLKMTDTKSFLIQGGGGS